MVNSVKGGREPESVEWFFDWLEDVSTERKSKKRKERGCRRMHFAVLGIDNSIRGHSRYNRVRFVFIYSYRKLQYSNNNKDERDAEMSGEWNVCSWRGLSHCFYLYLISLRNVSIILGIVILSVSGSSSDIFFYSVFIFLLVLDCHSFKTSL